MQISKKDVEDFVDHIVRIHDKIIDMTGGEKGVRDIGGLQHAAYEILKTLEKTDQRPFYTSAKIYVLLATRHYFIDGNKRISHVMAKLFMITSGYALKPIYKDAVNFIIEIADKRKSTAEIEEWIRNNSSKLENLDDYVNSFGKEFGN